MSTLLFLCFFWIEEPLHASTPRVDELNNPNPIVEEDIKITKAIDEAASQVDVTLAGKRIVDTTNATKITIRNQINWPSGGPFAYNPHLDLRLHLPNLEKKWQLKFITYDEDQEDLGINGSRLKTSPIRNDYAGSIGILQKLGQVSLQFEPRIEFVNGIQLSYYSRFTSSAQTKYFSIHPELQLFAKADTGTGEFFSGDTDFVLYKPLTFTVINEEQYLDQSNVFSTNNGVGFSFDYNDRMKQSTVYLLQFTSRPNFQLNEYTVSTAFIHKFYKNVLHYTVQPYLAFPSSLAYVGQPGLNFELDLIF
jgi:hypothetical protein